MIFPNHSERAKAFAAWLMIRNITAIRQDGSGDLLNPPAQDLLEVSCAASEFAYLYRDAQRNAANSIRAGVIVEVLWAMVRTDPNIASWERAIALSERYTIRQKAKLPANRQLFWDCLAKFQPVLHLLGARALRRPPTAPIRWVDRIVDLTPDMSVGYSRKIDLLFFAAEANALQEQLRTWDRGRDLVRTKCKANLLDERMFKLDATWNPPLRQPGWPDTGQLKNVLVEPEMMPKRGRAGRPKKSPSIS